MEKTIQTSELVEIVVETEAEAGVSGMSVAGGGREGIFIKDVLKDSPAARSLSLREGDQLLSARVYFDNIKYEDALQILKCAEPYKVSFCLKRTVPSADVAHKPGATTFEVRGPKAKMAKLNIQSLKPLKKKKKKKMKVAKGLQEAKVPGSGIPELVPIDVEFSLPMFSNLRRARRTGEVAVAEPSADISSHLSLLETKRRKMKFPRLKVKEAAAALAARTEGAERRLEVGLPKVAAVETKVAGRREGGGKVSRFTIPFPKAKKPKEPEVGFQAPQVELDLPLLKVGPTGEPSKASTKGEGFQIQAPSFGFPKVETVLPKVSTVGLEGPEGVLQAGLRVPTAEVAAPKVDVDLSLPKLGGAIPEVALKGEGVKIKDHKEAGMKMPTIKASVLKVALGEGKAEGLEEKPKLAMTMPTLEVDVPSADVEIPVLQRKAEAELPKQKVAIPDVSLKVPMVSLPKLGAKPHEELEGKLPQVELSVGKAESPKAKAKDPKRQIPGFGISLLKHKSESKEDVTVAADSKAKGPGVRVPVLDISVPRVTDVQLPTATVELAAPALGVKAEEAAKGPGFKLQMPQVSLPKFDIPAKTAPSPPRIHAKAPKPEVDLGMKVDVPKLDLSLPAAKLPDVELPKAHLPKPELDICVEKPKVEVAVPSARLSFPSAAVPALNIDVPKVGVELGLPKVEGEFGVSDQLPLDHEVKLKMPTVETIGKDLEVEISVPTCRVDLSELEPSERFIEGSDVSGMVAKIPKVDLAFGKEPPAAREEQGAGGISLDLPKLGLELESSLAGAKTKLPSVEIAAVTLPDVTVESGKSLKPEAKLKSPKFSLPKFSISGPKAWKMSTEASAPEVEGSELASKLKMPKFGISFPKSKWGAEVEGPKLVLGLEGKIPKEGAAVDVDSSGSGVKLPSVALPAVDFEVPKVTVDIGLPKGKVEFSDEEGSGISPEVGLDLPDIKLKVPKVSLPKFGGQEKESDLEFKAREAKLRGSREDLAAGLEKEPKVRVPKFKMPSFSMTRRDTADGSGPEVDAKLKKARGSPTEKPKGLLVRIPKLKLSSPKGEAERGKLHVQAPELQVKVPQVELPKMGTKEAEVEARLAVGSESPSLRVKVPSLEIAVPGTQVEGELIVEKPVVDVSVADIRSYDGELRIPKVPLLDVSAPKVELDLSLPTADAEVSMPHGAIDADAKIKLPKVELPKFGRSEEGGMKAGMQLLEGHRLSLGRAKEEEAEGTAEGATFATKIRVPKVDFSLPKARLSDVELPLTEEERSVEGPEGKFKMPSVGLPKFSTPKVKAPELEFDMSLEGGKMPKVKVTGPVIKLPKFGGSSSDREGEAEMELSRVPQLELKAPKLRGSDEVLGVETGGKEAKIKMPSVPIGFGLSKEEAEAAAGADESKFKLKIPALSISKAGAESSPDTQPLCPSADGADFSFKMPQITLPDVGFSVDQYGKGETGKLAGEAGVDVGGLEAKLKMPKIKMPTFEGSGPKGDTVASSPSQGCRGSVETDLEGKTAAAAAFKMPSLEISAPSLKTHAEYEVEGAQRQHISSQELEGAGKRSRASSDGRKSPGGKEESSDVDTGKKYRVKIPKFGLSLPKAGLETREGVPGQEAEAKIKRPIFVLGWPKVKAAEGSSGLLEGDDEAEGKSMIAKLKLRPTFGLSLSKPKTGAEVNGELEEGSSSKLKMPKLGFSKGEGAAQFNGERAEASLQNGAQDNKNKLGKIRLPQVELSSPSKMAETDPELNLKLVRVEEAKEEAGGGADVLAALKAVKFKSPKITFSGFKKRNGEAAPSAIVSSTARTEMASLETGDTASKGEKSPKFRFPKLVLSPKSHGVLEISSERQDSLTDEEEEGLKIKLPKVGFSGELSPEEQKGKATAAV